MGRIGVPLTALWALPFARALRGRRRAAYGAAVPGAIAYDWLALTHVIRLNMPPWWLGIVPWMPRAEDVGPPWVVPYNLLVYAGVLIGLAGLRTGSRAARGSAWPRDALLALLAGGLLIVAALERSARPDGPKGTHAVISAFGMGVGAAIIMLRASVFRRPRGRACGRTPEHSWRSITVYATRAAGRPPGQTTRPPRCTRPAGEGRQSPGRARWPSRRR